jgi:hypothetical protein
MMMRFFMTLALASSAFLLPTGNHAALGQEDEALKKLLEKIEPARPGAEKQEDDPAQAEKQKKDKDLDSMLEKLGIREDRPDTKGKAGPAGAEAKKDKADVAPEDQDLDAHLRRLLGRIDPKRDQNESDDGQEGGPMSDTMKKMREVEQRLAKLDTGEKTREEQQEIVKKLDRVLEQIKKARQQQQQGGQQDSTKMAGQQKGQQNQQGDPNSPNGGGAPPVKPKTPEQPTGLASAKDTWGHLQGSMRDVMDNVSRMMPLEGKQDLVERYFLSVAKRSVSRTGSEE